MPYRLLILTTLLLGGCGQKGPLYLPATPAPLPQAQTEPAAPADAPSPSDTEKDAPRPAAQPE